MSKTLNGSNLNNQSPSLMHELLKGLGVQSPATKHQAHNLTVTEMADLREKQANGDELPKIKANNDKTGEYEILEHEKHLFHVLLENEKWEKGKKLSKPRLQKFNQNDFLRMSKTSADVKKGEKLRPENAFGGFDSISVIHDPRLNEKSTKKSEEKTSEVKPLEEMSLEELREVFTSLGGEWEESDTEAVLLPLIKDEQAKNVK